MLLDTYQDAAERTDALDRHGDDPLVALLGLGAHAGELLDAHKQYLRTALNLDVATDLIAHELGALLWYTAAVARRHALTLSEIAHNNLIKTRLRAADRGIPDLGPVPEQPLDFATYQSEAALSDENLDNAAAFSVTVPLLGLVGEAGNLLNAQKKFYTHDEPTARDLTFLRTELGDLLWYIAAAASHTGLSLETVAVENLRHTARFDPSKADRRLPDHLPQLDEGFPVQERFPRKLVLRFRPVRTGATQPRQVQMHLVTAEPNAFPAGRQPLHPEALTEAERSKTKGYAEGTPIGDPLTDNSHHTDGYRFHDAIHLGFLAVLGWSPNMRSLLGVKRRSNPQIDENEDGARAIFAEEGVAAVLAKRALRHGNFLTESGIDGDTLSIVTTVFEHLEVSAYEPWIWRRAIAQGFIVMEQLSDNHGGGYVTVDLDRRRLTYSRTPPGDSHPQTRDGDPTVN